jgi:hypothetical protein
MSNVLQRLSVGAEVAMEKPDSLCSTSFEKEVTSTLNMHQYKLHANFLFYLHPNIPVDRADLAKDWVRIPGGERIIGYVEASRGLRGSDCRTVVVFGSTALFFKDTGYVSPFHERWLLGRIKKSTGSIPYEEFPDRRFKAKVLHIGVSLDKGQYLSIVDPLHRTIFVEVLNSLKEMVIGLLEKQVK